MKILQYISIRHISALSFIISIFLNPLLRRGLGRLFIIILCTFPLNALASSQEKISGPQAFEVIMERICNEHKNTNVNALDKKIEGHLQTLSSDGSFPDIDYTSRSQTVWNPLTHLNRVKDFALAYTIPSGKFYGNKAIYDNIVKMLEYWYQAHPTSTNWWFQQIAGPQETGIIFILMRTGEEKIPAELETRILERIQKEGGRPDQPGSLGTGANKLDIATHWIYRACLTYDEDLLRFSTDQAYYPLVMTTSEGLQHDFSYQQHGSQLYIGGYGYVLIEGIVKIASYMLGTPYKLADEKLDLLSNFVRRTYLPVIRGEYFMFNVAGRSMSRKNALNQKSFIPVLSHMMELDPVHKKVYQDAVVRINGQENASYSLQPYHMHFWRSDYTLHQRPGYSFDVRTASVYTTRSENGNGENLKGYFLTDGATDISIRGDEYAEIIPVWNWSHIPGVTAPAVNEVPRPRAWGTRGQSTFTGGVSTGKYGVSCYYFHNNDFDIHTTAKKSWFFFDKEVVCLGSDIHSQSVFPVHTTVNQCQLEGNVVAGRKKGIVNVEKGERVEKDVNWILHNNIMYYFPQKNDLYISNQPQSANWNDINNSVPDEIVKKDVFKLWINHGKNPQGESYSYIVVPNIQDEKQARAYNSQDVKIISNTASVQAVYHAGLDMLEVVFYEPTGFNYKDFYVAADKPCVLLLENASKNICKIYLTDPSRTQSEIKLTLKNPQIKSGKTLNFILNVYPDPYAGSTYEYSIY